MDKNDQNKHTVKETLKTKKTQNVLSFRNPTVTSLSSKNKTYNRTTHPSWQSYKQQSGFEPRRQANQNLSQNIFKPSHAVLSSTYRTPSEIVPGAQAARYSSTNVLAEYEPYINSDSQYSDQVSSTTDWNHHHFYTGSTLHYTTYDHPKAQPLSPDYSSFCEVPNLFFSLPAPLPFFNIPPTVLQPIPALPVPVTNFPVEYPQPYPVQTFISPMRSPLATHHLNTDVTYANNNLVANDSFLNYTNEFDQTIDELSSSGNEAFYNPLEEKYFLHNNNLHELSNDYLDPVLLIDAFCATKLETQDLLWILDLEFGYNPKYKRPVPVYDVQSRIITTNSGATHPGFDKCDEHFKEVLMLHYDSAVSCWYVEYMSLYGEKSVIKFQSWLDVTLQRDGMIWKYRNHVDFPIYFN